MKLRSIVASCYPHMQGKFRHKHVRKSLEPVLESHARKGQHGGLRHRGTEQASHHVRTHMYKCKAKKRSGACFFIDAIGAFDRVIRELLMASDVHVADCALKKLKILQECKLKKHI